MSTRENGHPSDLPGANEASKDHSPESSPQQSNIYAPPNAHLSECSSVEPKSGKESRLLAADEEIVDRGGGDDGQVLGGGTGTILTPANDDLIARFSEGKTHLTDDAQGIALHTNDGATIENETLSRRQLGKAEEDGEERSKSQAPLSNESRLSRAAWRIKSSFL